MGSVRVQRPQTGGQFGRVPSVSAAGRPGGGRAASAGSRIPAPSVREQASAGSVTLAPGIFGGGGGGVTPNVSLDLGEGAREGLEDEGAEFEGSKPKGARKVLHADVERLFPFMKVRV